MLSRELFVAKEWRGGAGAKRHLKRKDAKDRSPKAGLFGGAIARAKLRVTAANQPALRFNIAATSFIDRVGTSPSLLAEPKQNDCS